MIFSFTKKTNWINKGGKWNYNEDKKVMSGMIFTKYIFFLLLIERNVKYIVHFNYYCTSHIFSSLLNVFIIIFGIKNARGGYSHCARYRHWRRIRKILIMSESHCVWYLTWILFFFLIFSCKIIFFSGKSFLEAQDKMLCDVIIKKIKSN